MLDKIKDGIGDSLNSLLEYPDSFETPAARKAARIVADLLVILLGAGLFYMATRMNLSTIASPSMSTLMMAAPGVVLAGAGLSWLTQDILGKELSRTVGKVLTVVLPLLLAAGATCLVASGFHHGVTYFSFNIYWPVGLAIVPLSLFFIGNAAAVLCERERGVFASFPDANEVREQRRAREEEAMRRRIAALQEQLEQERLIQEIEEEREGIPLREIPQPIVESVSTSSSESAEEP